MYTDYGGFDEIAKEGSLFLSELDRRFLDDRRIAVTNTNIFYDFLSF